MEIYRTRTRVLPGTRWADVYKKAFQYYREIRSKTKRRPYIRSAYFKKDKIFLGIFWSHLYEKHERDRTRRLKYFPCALELVQNCRLNPESKDHLKESSQIVHRFTGITPEKTIFKVQIKEDKRSRQKWLISIFPCEK